MRILHTFGWDIPKIIYNLPNIAKQNFDTIILPPLQPSKFDYNKCWWGLYQIYMFVIGNSLGTREDLKVLRNEADKYGIKLVADLVTNQTAGMESDPLTPNPLVDETLRNNKYFWKEKREITEWENEWQVKHLCFGNPGLNLDNWDLQDTIMYMMDDYKNLGIDGFRIDAAKHLSFSFFNRVMMNSKYRSEYNFAEVINSSSYELSKYTKYMKVLTNTSGIDHNNEVVFCESHDSYLNKDANGYTRNTPEEIIIKDYIELCRQYPNTVFYPRQYNEEFSDRWMYDDIRMANC